MNVYKTENIRNVVLLGHGGAGKSTLAEAFGLTTGVITRRGTIADGNTISDFDKEEQKRQFSISTSVIPIEFNGIKINVSIISFLAIDETLIPVIKGINCLWNSFELI